METSQNSKLSHTDFSHRSPLIHLQAYLMGSVICFGWFSSLPIGGADIHVRFKLQLKPPTARLRFRGYSIELALMASGIGQTMALGFSWIRNNIGSSLWGRTNQNSLFEKKFAHLKKYFKAPCPCTGQKQNQLLNPCPNLYPVFYEVLMIYPPPHPSRPIPPPFLQA